MRLLLDADGRTPGPLGEADLAELYRHPAPEDRAWVRSNFVMSLDGSVQGPDGRSGSINTESDHHVFALHRAWADAVLVGAGTVRAEGYRAIDLQPWQQAMRVQQGLAPFPTLVIISPSGRIDPTVGTPAEGEGGPVLLVTTPGKPEGALAPLQEAGVEVVEVETPEIDLAAVVDQLAGAGLRRILCEGGPRLHRDLHADGLVDEVSLTLAPVVVGGEGLRSTGGGWIDPPAGFALRLALYADDGALFTCYRRSGSR